MHDVNLKDNYKEMDTKKSTQFVCHKTNERENCENVILRLHRQRLVEHSHKPVTSALSVYEHLTELNQN